ncbi:hypothetical protein [Sphingobacterium sp. BIGb0116]|uniref:hypothetical protein n=1 Tax=Sphingobacterium sp. BIGb0116 TaxID=2940619 RepID=UPI002169D282|nr:hypothetical protein [Sphingobacterium sp. BIGb0116]MCS4165301.1 hypothetical protein [Sphingobacterium sp. BIGb0116]
MKKIQLLIRKYPILRENESQFVAAGNSKMNDFGTIPTMLTTALEQDITKNY